MQSRVLPITLAAIVVASACAPAAALSPPPSPPPTVVATASQMAALDIAALSKRIDLGRSVEYGLILNLQKSALAEDLELVRSTNDALSDWASAEQVWLADHPTDACAGPIATAYEYGIRSVGLGSLSLGILLTGVPSDEPVSPEDIRSAFEQLTGGHDQITHAKGLADDGICLDQSSAAPSLVEATAAGYLDLADAVNARNDSLRTQEQQQPTADQVYAETLLSIERDALTGLETWGDREATVTALRSRLSGVIANLQEARLTGSVDSAHTSLLTALFALIAQRKAAAAVRAALGLPIMKKSDLL